MVITLGGVHKFRFNHPAEAAVLRERRRVGNDQLKMKMLLLIKMALMVLLMMMKSFLLVFHNIYGPRIMIMCSSKTDLFYSILRPVKVA